MNPIPELDKLAPEFSAIDADGNTKSLKDFAGKWLVFYFYPKDNTPGCTTEAKDFTELQSNFTDVGAPLVGVSTASNTSHCKFIDKQGLSITLLSDPEHQVAEAYGVWQLKKFMGKEYMGVVRSTFLINPQGAIAHIWTKVKVKGHAGDVLTKLQELTT